MIPYADMELHPEEPEPTIGVWRADGLIAADQFEAARLILEAAFRDGVTGPMKAGGVTWTFHRIVEHHPEPEPRSGAVLVYVLVALVVVGVVVWWWVR